MGMNGRWPLQPNSIGQFISLSLSVLMAIFQVNLGQPVFIEAKDDGSGGDNWSYRSCKAPVKSSPPTNQYQVFLQAGCPSCRPTNSVKARKGKYHILWNCLPQTHLWGLPTLSLTTIIAPGYLGEVCHASHQPSDVSTLLVTDNNDLRIHVPLICLSERIVSTSLMTPTLTFRVIFLLRRRCLSEDEIAFSIEFQTKMVQRIDQVFICE